MWKIKSYLQGNFTPDNDHDHRMMKRESYNFVVQEDLLYRTSYPRGTKDVSYQLVIPENHRQAIIQTCHTEVWGGHHGVSRTMEKLRRRYFWHNMFDDVVNFIRNCLDCNTGKSYSTNKACT